MSEQKKTTPTTKTPTKQMRVRARISVLVVVGLFFLANVLRLGYLQIFEAEDWQRRAVSQQLSDTVVSAKRGTIYAADMSPLAESADVWKIIMSPKNIAACDWKALEGVDKDRQRSKEEGLELVRRRIAEDLAVMFDLDEEKLYEKTGKTHSQYEVIKSKVEYNQKNEFSAWVEKNGLNYAFYIITDYKRYYSRGALASTVLGFTGTDNNGLEGLEAKYDSLLTGTPGRIVTAQNGIGDEMPTTMEYTKVVDAVDGYGLVTTIDPVVQMYTEKYLSEAVVATNTQERGVAIVMDVNTGAILAMSTKDDYNPNDPYTITNLKTEDVKDTLAGKPAEAEETPEEEQPEKPKEEKEESPANRWKNKAITDPYEPGSVFKVFTTAMALEEGLANEHTSFACKGSISVGGHNISCHTRTHMGILNLHDAISKSCNPYFVQLGQRIGADVYYKYFNGFGFTEKTGIDMNGEASNAGLYHSYETLATYESSLATGAFGQTFKVTPIQMITAMSAIANGGKLLTPYVVSKVLDDEGNVISETQPKVKRQIISEETSSQICEILGDIVNGGGSKNAYVPGYRIAGKTGTSEKRDTVENKDDVVASFCGFAPADDPQVAVLVLLDDPQTEIRYGGTLSAPVAQKIFESILPHLGVEPSYTSEELASLSRTTPHVVGQAVQAAENKVTSVGLKAKVVGDGDKVVRQVPEAGQSVPAGGTVLLYTEEEEVTLVTVPDLTGRSVTEVTTIATNLGLNVQMQGLVGGSSAAAISNKQSIQADTKVPKGTVIVVTFAYTDTRDG